MARTIIKAVAVSTTVSGVLLDLIAIKKECRQQLLIELHKHDSRQMILAIERALDLRTPADITMALMFVNTAPPALSTALETYISSFEAVQAVLSLSQHS